MEDIVDAASSKVGWELDPERAIPEVLQYPVRTNILRGKLSR